MQDRLLDKILHSDLIFETEKTKHKTFFLISRK